MNIAAAAPRTIGFLSHLRTRFAIWRLEQRVEAAVESAEYHDRLAHVAMGVAARQRRILREGREQLERITTALSNGIAL